MSKGDLKNNNIVVVERAWIEENKIIIIKMFSTARVYKTEISRMFYFSIQYTANRLIN